MASQRSRAIALYKQLIFLGRDYPKEPEVFVQRVHDAFAKNSKITDSNEIELCLAKAEYVVKELEALYKLRKYRSMKRRYYDQ